MAGIKKKKIKVNAKWDSSPYFFRWTKQKITAGTSHLVRSHLTFTVLYMLNSYTEDLLRKYEEIREE